MKDTIPTPLQSQILIYAALSAAALAAGLATLFYLTPVMALAFLLLAVLTAANAVRIDYAALHGRCIALKGTVLNVEHTAVLRRPRAFLAEIDGKALRVLLRSRLRAPRAGGCVTIYVLDNTPIYPWRSVHQLASYLTISMEDNKDG